MEKKRSFSPQTAAIIAQHWQKILRSAWEVLYKSPVGGPDALCCLRIVKGILVHMHQLQALTEESLARIKEVRDFFINVAKQIIGNCDALDSKYLSSAVKLIQEVVLHGKEASDW